MFWRRAEDEINGMTKRKIRAVENVLRGDEQSLRGDDEKIHTVTMQLRGSDDTYTKTSKFRRW